MLCCHGNNRWTRRIFIVVFFFAGVWFPINGESVNNGSQPEIVLVPEMDVPVPVPQSKSHLDPQEMPPQLQVANPSTAEPKTPGAAALHIPEVEISLSDRDKQNTQQVPQAQDRTTHPQTVVEISHTEVTTTQEPEAASSGFTEADQTFVHEHAVEAAEGIEYPSGNGNTEMAWESARTEVNFEKLENFSLIDFDPPHPTSASERNRGSSDEFAQTEVVYDFGSTTDVAAIATTNRPLANSNSSGDATGSEFPAPSKVSPSEQSHFFSTSAVGHAGHSNNSNDSSIAPETTQIVTTEATQTQNVSTESWHLASTSISNASEVTQYGVSQLGKELRLLQDAHTSSEILSAATENSLPVTGDASASTNMSNEINATHSWSSPPIFVTTTTPIMDSRGTVHLLDSNVLNNNSRASETTNILNSSFLSADFSSTEMVPMRIINVTELPSVSTPFIYHFTATDEFSVGLSNSNDTLEEKHNGQVAFFGRNSDSPENVVSERINPTKPSSDKDGFPGDDDVNTLASDDKQGITETDVQLKRENDTKSLDNGNKTQDPATSQPSIHKNETDDGQKISANILAGSSALSSWTTSVPELTSSTDVISVTDRSSFSTTVALEIPLDQYHTMVFHENSSISLSTIQPSQTLKQTQGDSTETNRENQPTMVPDTEVDHVLPTLKIPTMFLSMTLRCSWSYFCVHQDELRNIFVQLLFNVSKHAIRASQIVFFDTNVCKQFSYDENEVNDDYVNLIVVQTYVANRHGAFSEHLTRRLFIVLLKIKLQGFNDKMKLSDVRLTFASTEERNHTAVVLPHQHGDPGSNMGIIAAITISGIAGVCLILLCILLVVLKRRQILKQQSRRCRPVRPDAYSLDSISIYSSFYKRKMRASKRSYLNQGFEDPNAPTNKLNFAGLASLSTDENALAEEYKQIPMSMAKFGDLPPGADLKNRYANVIPFPETRVQLPAKEGDATPGYINANYVRGFRGDQRTYIACQAPLESTVADFWEMIWENQSKVIVMLTDWEEEGVAKCFPYFAESATIDSHRRFGDFQVTTKKIDTRESFTISSLQLKNLEKNLMRDLVHFWYTAWPALGVPSDKASIVEMLAEARSAMRAASAPTVVHCSPGTGRTGTVLAIHASMQEYETSRTIDIPQCVGRLRRDRGGCVQTSEQYRFIYEVLHEFASQFRNPSGRSSIRSSK